jgi:hypothetical protein
MSEWVKVLVGLISGIGIGVLAEPLKRWVGTAYMTKRAEKAIYWEMSAMYVIFCMDKKTIEDARFVHLGPEFKPERFDYYFAEQRESLFGIETWNGIKRVYDTFRTAKQKVDSGQISDAEGADLIGNEFKMCMELGLIDKDRIFKK